MLLATEFQGHLVGPCSELCWFTTGVRIDVPTIGGFFCHTSPKQIYLLEMKYPQLWGDVKHWDIETNPCTKPVD